MKPEYPPVVRYGGTRAKTPVLEPEDGPEP
jgi:hypothetical protein